MIRQYATLWFTGSVMGFCLGCQPATQQENLSWDNVSQEVSTFYYSEKYLEAESTLVVHQSTFQGMAEWLAFMGRIKTALLQDEEAIDYLSRALEADAEDLSSRVLLAQVYQRTGDLDLSKKVIEGAREQEHPRLLFEQGQIALKEGLFDVSLAHFEQAYRSDSTFLEALYAIGNVLGRLGRSQEAENIFAKYEVVAARAEDLKLDQQILELNPDSPEAHYNLARAYEEQGNLLKAVQYYQETIQLDSLFQEAYNNIGILYFQAGEDDLAAQSFSKAISISDTTAKYYFNLGAVYARRGVLDEAERLWLKSLELDPEYEKARTFLDQLEASKK